VDLSAAKAAFFDKKAVRDRLDPEVRKALGRLGGYARRVARNSLKYGPPHAAAGAGEPPLVHQLGGFTRAKKNKKTGATARQPASPLKELLLYAYDPGSRSVVAGPALWPGSRGGGARVLTAVEERHPVMGPALRKTLPQVGPNFKALIR
jgi:hypothetical protein